MDNGTYSKISIQAVTLFFKKFKATELFLQIEFLQHKNCGSRNNPRPTYNFVLPAKNPPATAGDVRDMGSTLG